LVLCLFITEFIGDGRQGILAHLCSFDESAESVPFLFEGDKLAVGGGVEIAFDFLHEADGGVVGFLVLARLLHILFYLHIKWLRIFKPALHPQSMR